MFDYFFNINLCSFFFINLGVRWHDDHASTVIRGSNDQVSAIILQRDNKEPDDIFDIQASSHPIDDTVIYSCGEKK